MKKIVVHESWSFDDIRAMCIREHFYTCGTCADYEIMLNFVSKNDPTPENIYTVADNIALHSSWDDDNWTHTEKVENVAFCIVNNAIRRWCELV